MSLLILLSRDIGTNCPSGVAAMARESHSLTNQWLENQLNEAGFDYKNPEFPESNDPEAYDLAVERANELHYRLSSPVCLALVGPVPRLLPVAPLVTPRRLPGPRRAWPGVAAPGAPCASSRPREAVNPENATAEVCSGLGEYGVIRVANPW